MREKLVPKYWRHGASSIIAIFLGTVAASGAYAIPSYPVVINEILASHSGTDDTEFVELYGTPGTSLAGLSLVVVEGDAFDPGRIDRRLDFTSSDVIGTNMFFLVGNPTGLSANYGVTPNKDIFNNYFENSSFTVALVETSTVDVVGGLIVSSENVIDALGLNDGDAGDQFFFGAPVIGPDGPFFPAGARRIADGVDTNTTADWTLASFNLPGNNTPTAGTVPEPATLALFGLGLAGLGLQRRRRAL